MGQENNERVKEGVREVWEEYGKEVRSCKGRNTEKEQEMGGKRVREGSGKRMRGERKGPEME